MLHIIHTHDAGIINKVVIGLSLLVGRLPRDGLFFENTAQLGLQKIQSCIHVVGIAVIIIDTALYHAIGLQQVLLRRLRGILPTTLGLVVGICIKDRKHRLSHEVYIRKLPGFPVCVISFGILEPLDDGIAVDQLHFFVRWFGKRPLSQRDFLQILIGRSV